MKKIFAFITVLVVILTLSACSSKSGLESIGLDGMTGKDILLGLADGSVVVDGYAISVYDDELVVILEDSRVSVDMPKDEFYLSVAPFINNTHECLYHSATGCRAELKQEEFFVEFIDSNGETIVSENMMSMSNGFIDLWLPRDVEGTLTITQGELSTSKLISTESGEPTCETTMQLT